MANEQHLKILRQGVGAWNFFKKQQDEFHELVGPNLEDARIGSALLNGINLINTNLMDARLAGTCLDGARLDGAHLDRARLDRVSLVGANLDSAHLAGARLADTCLDSANLFTASLDGTYLDGVSFAGAIFGGTAIVDVDLSQSDSLETVTHHGPSGIATSTLERTAVGLARDPSRRDAIETFLRGCGLSDWEIKAAKLHQPGLTSARVSEITAEVSHLKTESPTRINPLFISHSHADAPFVEALERRFGKKRIRYWRDVHDLKAGRLETQIDRAIRHNPIVLLVLSEASVESDWVEWEVSKARELEKTEKRDVLCPVTLDDSWKTCSWPGPLRRQVEDYNILDFSEWQDDAAMERQFQRLIDGLGMFYPKGG